jgi:molybdate transport system ATP-binding protein
LLLLDEPLAALDTVNQSKIIEDLRGWNAAHCIPIIYATHSAREAFALGDHIVVLESGRVLSQGTPHQVLEEPRHETVAQLVGFENVFDASIVSFNQRHGTMFCRLAGSEVELEVPLGRATPGALLRIAIRAGDIMVASVRPRGLSARNIFQGRLASLYQQGTAVVASVEAGVTFEVHLTSGACEELQLAAGQQLWLVIKTYSCHLVDQKN